MEIKKALLLVVLFAFSSVGCTSILFFPTSELLSTPREWGIDYEDVSWQVDGEHVHGWFMKAPSPVGTVLVLHGNAENRSTHFQSVAWLLHSHFNVLIFDYGGFADSEGEVSIPSAIRDALGGLHYLSERGDSPIAVLGQSIGGAIAVCAVAEQQGEVVSALVIEGAPYSYRRAARDALRASWLTSIFSWPLSFLVTDLDAAWRCASKVHNIPVVMIHSKEDGIVPFHHFESLQGAFPNTKVFHYEATGPHLNAFAAPEIRKVVVDLLRRSMRAPEK